MLPLRLATGGKRMTIRTIASVLGAGVLLAAPAAAQDTSGTPAGQTFDIAVATEHCTLRFDDAVEARDAEHRMGIGNLGCNGAVDMISWTLIGEPGAADFRITGAPRFESGFCMQGWPHFEVGERRDGACWLDPDLGGGTLSVTVTRTQ